MNVTSLHYALLQLGVVPWELCDFPKRLLQWTLKLKADTSANHVVFFSRPRTLITWQCAMFTSWLWWNWNAGTYAIISEMELRRKRGKVRWLALTSPALLVSWFWILVLPIHLPALLLKTVAAAGWLCTVKDDMSVSFREFPASVSPDRRWCKFRFSILPID